MEAGAPSARHATVALLLLTSAAVATERIHRQHLVQAAHEPYSSRRVSIGAGGVSAMAAREPATLARERAGKLVLPSSKREGGGRQGAARGEELILTLEELACALVRPLDAAYASAGSVGCPFTQLRSARRRGAEYGGRMETVSWDRRAARSPGIPATLQAGRRDWARGREGAAGVRTGVDVWSKVEVEVELRGSRVLRLSDGSMFERRKAPSKQQGRSGGQGLING